MGFSKTLLSPLSPLLCCIIHLREGHVEYFIPLKIILSEIGYLGFKADYKGGATSRPLSVLKSPQLPSTEF